MSKPIDLAAVREAHANLDRLAKEHPELLGQSTTEEWEAVLTAQSGTERQKRLIAKRQASGMARLSIWLTDEEVEALRNRYPGPRGGVDWQAVAAAALRGSDHAA